MNVFEKFKFSEDKFNEIESNADWKQTVILRENLMIYFTESLRASFVLNNGLMVVPQTIAQFYAEIEKLNKEGDDND